MEALAGYEHAESYSRQHVSRAPKRNDTLIEGRKGSHKASQYSHMYFMRLAQLRPVVSQVCRERFPAIHICTNSLDLSKVNSEAIVIGTVFKQMALKPSALDEYHEDALFTPPVPGEETLSRSAEPTVNCMASDSDTLVVEDEFGRIPLTSTNSRFVHDLVHGLVLGFRGRMLESGTFSVEEVIFPGLAPQRALTTPGPEGYIAIVSGLGVGGGSGDPLKLEILCDFLTGFTGDSSESYMASKITHVLVAGNMLALERTKQLDSLASSYHSTRKNEELRRSREELGKATKQLDVLISQLGESMTVLLAPGHTDPTSYLLPQPPIAKPILPLAYALDSVLGISNPASFELEGCIDVAMSSGQSVDDILKWSQPCNGNLDAAGSILHSRILAPTSPDTLACFPFTESDPLVMNKSPHLMVVGNQPEFKVSTVSGVTIVCVPSFAEKGTIALVKLSDLTVEPICFSA